MSLETSLTSFVNAVGADIKLFNQNQGDLTALTTAQKTSIVLAINSLKTALDTLQDAQANAAGINDAGSTSSTTETYSISKIIDIITTATNTLKQDILGSAPAALDTLQELAAALNDNASFATDIATAIGNRVRYDESQALTSAQQGTARSNIDAASKTDYDTFVASIGDPTVDLLATYNTAKS